MKLSSRILRRTGLMIVGSLSAILVGRGRHLIDDELNFNMNHAQPPVMGNEFTVARETLPIRGNFRPLLANRTPFKGESLSLPVSLFSSLHIKALNDEFDSLQLTEQVVDLLQFSESEKSGVESVLNELLHDLESSDFERMKIDTSSDSRLKCVLLPLETPKASRLRELLKNRLSNEIGLDRCDAFLEVARRKLETSFSGFGRMTETIDIYKEINTETRAVEYVLEVKQQSPSLMSGYRKAFVTLPTRWAQLARAGNAL